MEEWYSMELLVSHASHLIILISELGKKNQDPESPRWSSSKCLVPGSQSNT